jgi:type II secretory pathway pseudopilin PulG
VFAGHTRHWRHLLHRLAVVADCEQDQGGFAYLGLLFLVVLIGLGLASVATVWHTAVRRENEQELLFVGEQFRSAIKSYYESTPGSAKEYPRSLDDLVLDPRFPNARRHLRHVFVDPMTGKPEWGLVTRGDRIIGVHSLAEGPPLRVAGFRDGEAGFGAAKALADWKFVYNAASAAAAQPASVSGFEPVPTQPAETVPLQPLTDPAAGADDSRHEGNECTELRRTDMLRCLDLQGDERNSCEKDSTKRYVACLRERR